MNIFALDTDPRIAASLHCDQHVVKMTLESVQMLCTVLHERGVVVPYRPTHRYHPCTRWVQQSFDNFCWLRDLAYALNDEYRFRFQKDVDHKSITVLRDLPGHDYPRVGLTEFVQAMPDHYKVPHDPVAAYRRYYIGDKLTFARWTRRAPPCWVPQ